MREQVSLSGSARGHFSRRMITGKGPSMKRKEKARLKHDQPAAPSMAEARLQELKDLGFKYVQDKDFIGAQLVFRKVIEFDKTDINVRFVYAHLIDDGTHKKRAEARDLMLSILDENPDIFDKPTDGNLELIRGAAVRCSHVGPLPKAIELFRKLAHASNSASDYFLLSEILTQDNSFEESIASLVKAMALDPARFDTPANRDTLQVARSQLSQATSKAAGNRRTVGRYPQTADFLGDFQKLVS